MGFYVYGIGYQNGDRAVPLYVGKTKESLSVRWSKHRSSCRLHPNQNLHRFIVKHGGEEQFEMFLIEELESEKHLSAREKHYIGTLKPPLNVHFNLSNAKKIKVDIKKETGFGTGPFTSVVLFVKWLTEDFKKATEICFKVT